MPLPLVLSRIYGCLLQRQNKLVEAASSRDGYALLSNQIDTLPCLINVFQKITDT